jgi:lambda repressor-like predicted transcriptional regulator
MTPNATAPPAPRTVAVFFDAEPAQRLLARAADVHDGDLSALAAVLRLDRSTLYRVLSRDRLRYDAADRIAVSLGRHPSELWPEWFCATDQVTR